MQFEILFFEAWATDVAAIKTGKSLYWKNFRYFFTHCLGFLIVISYFEFFEQILNRLYLVIRYVLCRHVSDLKILEMFTPVEPIR